MNGFDKMNSKFDVINKIIDTLKLINNVEAITILDKDIILQQLREAYIAVLEMDTEITCPSCNEGAHEPGKPALTEETESVPETAVQESEDPVEVTQPEIAEAEIPSVAGPEQIEEVTVRETFEVSFTSEITNVIPEETPVTEEPTVMADPIPEIKEPELFADHETTEIAEKPSTQSAVHTIPVPELSFSSQNQEQEFEGDEDILHFISSGTKPAPQPQPEKKEESVPVADSTEVLSPGPVTTEIPQVKNPEVVTAQEPEIKIDQVYHAEVTVETTTSTQKRSLNDLLTEKKEDNSLNTKFQNAKIVDLTKSISINDKFLFIKELFRNRGEEFSQSIQALNNCRDIEEAFGVMEKLKKHYFWDSTSPAYLALCDLVRRKF